MQGLAHEFGATGVQYSNMYGGSPFNSVPFNYFPFFASNNGEPPPQSQIDTLPPYHNQSPSDYAMHHPVNTSPSQYYQNVPVLGVPSGPLERLASSLSKLDVVGPSTSALARSQADEFSPTSATLPYDAMFPRGL